jgi:type IV secretion system protein TrbL
MRGGPLLWRASLAIAAAGAGALASAPPARADVPGSGIVRDAVGGIAGWGFEKVAEGIAKWVLDAAAFFIEGALEFLQTSARPEVEADWFAGAGSPFATVRNLAAVLLLAFAFLGMLQGLLHGDVGMMVRQVVGKLPLAVAGMVLTTAVVARLLDLTDALSAAVLDTTGDQALHFLSGFGLAASGLTMGFAAVVVGLIAVLAGLLLWVELIIRSSLVYLLVAVSPLGFAAMLWPAARGFLRKTVEILIAVILSKFVICVALSVGVAALSGAGQATDGGGVSAGFGTLLVGSGLLGLAAFSPFLVLKLVPAAEAALVAQGVSHGPARAVHSGAATYSAVARLSGGSRLAPPATAGSDAAGGAPVPGPSVAAGPKGTGGGSAGAGAAAGAATATIAGASTAARRAGNSAGGASNLAGDRDRSERSEARLRGSARPERGSGQ